MLHPLTCRRYEKAQKPLSAFDADISKYADLSEEVLAENAAESIKFLFVDCGPLKQVSSTHALFPLSATEVTDRSVLPATAEA